MSCFNPSNVYCQQPPVKIAAGHKSVPMTISCPPNITSNFTQWIYNNFKVYITNSALFYQFDHVSTLMNEWGVKQVLMTWKFLLLFQLCQTTLFRIHPPPWGSWKRHGFFCDLLCACSHVLYSLILFPWFHLECHHLFCLSSFFGATLFWSTKVVLIWEWWHDDVMKRAA